MPAHHAFWPKRLPHQLTAPQTSLWMNLQISALRFPGKEALVFMGQTWTYAQFMHQAESIASALRKMGVQKGDRVVLDMQNCPQLVITHFAILRLDAVVVPVNPMNRMEELKHYILDPDTKVAVTTADLAPELAAASNALELSLIHI
jgi:fatty-acyl-CoA synthase